jgi:type IV pilus assembly protein PilA
MASVCAACGNSLTEGDQFCRVCGRQTPAMPAAAAPPVVETSAKALISLICGLSFFIPFAFIAAIVLGHIALSEIKKSAGLLKGEGYAIAGLVLGYMWIAAIPVILIIAAIAIPNLLRARMAANESSAVNVVRTLNTAEIAYAAAHPDAGFTCSLSDLSEGRTISIQLATGQKNGYIFELRNCSPPVPGGANVKFQVVAYPITRNQTGTRAFCSDESSVIKVDGSGSAQRCLEHGVLLR